MTYYTGVKTALEEVMGGKFKCLPTMLLSDTECSMFIRAAVMVSQEYTFYIFEDTNGNVYYHAVETASRLPVSWHRESKSCDHNCKFTGYNYGITLTPLDDYRDKDYKIMRILGAAMHCGHYSEKELFK